NSHSKNISYIDTEYELEDNKEIVYVTYNFRSQLYTKNRRKAKQKQIESYKEQQY
ncbi:13428_t:CDS:1, partial [Racocetra persica]